MASADFVECTREAIVAVVDSDPGIVAITGRDVANLLPFDAAIVAERPVIAFEVIVADELAADQDTRHVLTQFSASAALDSTANELLGVLERILTQSAFLALAEPLDALIVRRVRRALDLDVLMRVTRPLAA